MRFAWIVAAILPLSISAASIQSRENAQICHGDLCYPTVFEPTDEFARVYDDQKIPAGLHVKIDLTTGDRVAKLMSPGTQSGDSGDTSIALVEDGDVQGAETSEQRPARPYPPTNYIGSSDLATFNRALKVIATDASCTDTVKDALNTLEELVHELEFGLKLIDSERSGGFVSLQKYLHGSDASCRASAALVLGSALRNNANALQALPRSPALTTQLVGMLKTESDDAVRRMLVYALSASMTEEDSRHDYRVADGHVILHRAFEHGSEELKGKIGSFVEDHFAQVPETSRKVIIQKGIPYEKQVSDHDALETWCNSFQQTLLSKPASLSVREKLLSSVSQIKRSDLEACSASRDFLQYLADESIAKDGTASDSIVAMARSARSLFGNIKASRKHDAEFL